MSATSYQFNANTGVANISTANPNLDGTGNLGLVITGANASGTNTGGTVIKSITIKATQATTQGMVRLFTGDGSGGKWLLMEITVPPTNPTSILPAFTAVIPTKNLVLKAGDELYASTQNAESFNVIADGLNFGSCSCSTNNCGCDAQIKYGASEGQVNISTPNSNLDGTGAMSLVVADSNTPNCGTIISRLMIKATQDTTQGMVRFFLSDGVKRYLFSEVPIYPVTTNSGVLPALFMSIQTDFTLASGYSLYASTENAESFNIISNGTDFTCCGCPQQ